MKKRTKLILLAVCVPLGLFVLVFHHKLLNSFFSIVGTTCGKSGMAYGIPRTDCKCGGIKIRRKQGPWFDAGSMTFCLGKVEEMYTIMPGPIVHFKVSPETADIAIMGTGQGGYANRSEVKKYIDLKDGNFILHRSYEIHGDKKTLYGSSPIHIEISNPGYKTWVKDIVSLESDPIEIEVKLEKDNLR